MFNAKSSPIAQIFCYVCTFITQHEMHVFVLKASLTKETRIISKSFVKK